MINSRIKAALTAAIIIIFLFCSCGEMDFSFPVSRNYQVSAQGEIYSLDEYAVIKKDEKIQPFFISPINGDPDVASLTVSIITSKGKKSGTIIRYVLKSIYEIEKSNNYDSEDEFYTLTLERMDEKFPAFTMPKDLQAAHYTLVFQVFGKNQVLLAKTEKNVYYTAEEDFNLTDISAYLPGLAPTSHLVPPETVVLLEAGVIAGDDLDPYIIWYNGKIVLGEGKVSEGANAILWHVPPQTGFQSIRAEVLPFPPVNEVSASAASPKPERILRGMTREISLPIFGKKESLEDASKFLTMMDPDDKSKVLWRYHPSGALDDPLNPFPPNTLLAWEPPPGKDSVLPCWISSQDGFGLGIGPQDIYSVPPFSLEKGNRFSFILRLVSLNEGSHFSVFFHPIGTELIFSREAESFVLILQVGEKEERIPVEIPFRDNFITLFLDLTFLEEDFFLSLKEEGDIDPRAEKHLSQWNPEGVQGTFQLGGWSNQDLPVMILGELSMVSSPVEPLADAITPSEEVLISQVP